MTTQLLLDHDLDPDGHRVLGQRGADAVVSGSYTLTVGDGNFFVIDASAGLKFIDTAGWTVGSHIILQCHVAGSVYHQASSPPSGFAALQTATEATITVSTDRVVPFVYDGSYWTQVGTWS